MEVPCISGKSAFNHLFDFFHFGKNFEIDVLILHAPGQEDVGNTLARQIQEGWNINMKKKYAADPLISENFVSFPKLSIISLDATYLCHASILEPLRKHYQKLGFFCGFCFNK